MATKAKGKHIGFAKLKGELGKRKGVTNPGALAAYIGRKKYGAKGMAKMSGKGRTSPKRKESK